MDCRTNGDVVMNAYNANDCGGAPISSTILALSATCYAYSYSLSDTVSESVREWVSGIDTNSTIWLINSVLIQSSLFSLIYIPTSFPMFLY